MMERMENTHLSELKAGDCFMEEGSYGIDYYYIAISEPEAKGEGWGIKAFSADTLSEVFLFDGGGMGSLDLYLAKTRQSRSR
jgi:hypothetical protein